jgi:hypothetical protein
LASAAFLRASASASARFAAGDNGLRSASDAAAAGREESSVISQFPAAGFARSIQGFRIKMTLQS